MKVGVKSVAGFEFDEDQEFCEAAVVLLNRLALKGVVYWQIDDGPHPEVDQLRTAANNDGYFEYVRLGSHRHLLFVPDECEAEVFHP